jgi:hypothetical protein
MDGTENHHIVQFDKYCPKCQNEKEPETNDACWDCLNEGVTLNGLPNNFKEKKDTEKKDKEKKDS